MYIDDCLRRIYMIMHCDQLAATPGNLGSSELHSIDEPVAMAEEIACIRLRRIYDPAAPRGVMGCTSDNTLLRQMLNWEPSTPLRQGLKHTYTRIEEQYPRRKAALVPPRDWSSLLPLGKPLQVNVQADCVYASAAEASELNQLPPRPTPGSSRRPNKRRTAPVITGQVNS